MALLTPSAGAARQVQRGDGQGVKSREGRSAALTLLEADPLVRRRIFADLARAEQRVILQEVAKETGTIYGLWADTPSGFVEDVIGETVWSLQRDVLDAIVDHKRVAVPAGFGVGKTWLAGRLVAWAGATNPAGSIVIVTTATRFRQVRNQLWPHIKTAVAKAALPGETDTVQWKMPDLYGNDVLVSYGFSAPANDEAAMQGIHGTPKLLLVVDEAGGIAPLIGKGTNNLLTGDAKLLAIGNPAMSDPGSWFEGLCAEGESGEEPSTTTIRIRSVDSPAMTGEPTPVCRACTPNLDGHTIAGGNPPHLPDMDWLRRTLREYGANIEADSSLAECVAAGRDNGHPYIVAKVLAEFPRDGGAKALPPSWVESAVELEDPSGPEWLRLCDLGLDGETERFTVRKGSWVRLGVDVAADGGDEFTIYRSIGDVVHFRHASSGSANDNQVTVAEKVLEEIRRAQRLADALGSHAKVRVKVDKNGLGHGVVGMLERWGPKGMKKHDAQIVGVMVSESPREVDPGAVMRPWRKRDEMWLSGRFLIQPDPSTGEGRLRLRVDSKCARQLTFPGLGENSSGFTVIESKKAMRARGIDSPDRAEGALLALYEPDPVLKNKRRGIISGA